MNNHIHPIIRGVAIVAMALSIDSARAASSTPLVDSPVSQDYMIRTQVIEGVRLARSAMARVANEYAFWGKSIMTSYSETGASGNYVTSVKVVNGRIDITYGGVADAAIAGKTLSLTPYETADQHVVWRCGNRPEPPNLQLLGASSPAPASYVPSTVDDQYSSAACAIADGFPGSVAYRGDVIRKRIAQGLKLANAAKKVVASNATTLNSLATAASIFNAQNGGKGLSNQYVTMVQIVPYLGVIAVQFDAASVGLKHGEDSLFLTPFIFAGGYPSYQLGAVLGSGMEGAIGWACTSSTKAIATSMGMGETLNGTLLSSYAPPQCR